MLQKDFITYFELENNVMNCLELSSLYAQECELFMHSKEEVKKYLEAFQHMVKKIIDLSTNTAYHETFFEFCSAVAEYGEDCASTNNIHHALSEFYLFRIEQIFQRVHADNKLHMLLPKEHQYS